MKKLSYLPKIIISAREVFTAYDTLKKGTGAFYVTDNYEFLSVENVPECTHSRLVQVSDGRSKCEFCGKKYKLKSDWIPCEDS
jgi:hypothetical protein